MVGRSIWTPQSLQSLRHTKTPRRYETQSCTPCVTKRQHIGVLPSRRLKTQKPSCHEHAQIHPQKKHIEKMFKTDKPCKIWENSASGAMNIRTFRVAQVNQPVEPLQAEQFNKKQRCSDTYIIQERRNSTCDNLVGTMSTSQTGGYKQLQYTPQSCLHGPLRYMQLIQIFNNASMPHEFSYRRISKRFARVFYLRLISPAKSKKTNTENSNCTGDRSNPTMIAPDGRSDWGDAISEDCAIGNLSSHPHPS